MRLGRFEAIDLKYNYCLFALLAMMELRYLMKRTFDKMAVVTTLNNSLARISCIARFDSLEFHQFTTKGVNSKTSNYSPIDLVTLLFLLALICMVSFPSLNSAQKAFDC